MLKLVNFDNLTTSFLCCFLSPYVYTVILPDSEAAKDLSKADIAKRMKVR